MKRLAIRTMLVLAVIMMTACGGGSATPEEILAEAADVVTETATLGFAIEREGEPVVIDPELEAAMLSAEGVYEAPENVYAEVRVDAGGIVVGAGVIWRDGTSYIVLPPFVPEYEETTIHETFAASDIFDDGVGLPNILRELGSPTLIGVEDVEGVKTYHITAASDSEEFSNLVGGAISPGEVTIDIWINKKTSETVQVLLTEANGDTWDLYFFDYGAEVEIPTP